MSNKNVNPLRCTHGKIVYGVWIHKNNKFLITSQKLSLTDPWKEINLLSSWISPPDPFPLHIKEVYKYPHHFFRNLKAAVRCAKFNIKYYQKKGKSYDIEFRLDTNRKHSIYNGYENKTGKNPAQETQDIKKQASD